MTRARNALLLSLLAFAPQACSRIEAWQFTFAPGERGATLTTDRVIVIFEGVALTHPPGGTTGGATGSLVVAGYGTHSSSVTVRDKVFATSFADGVNTMTLEGYTCVLRKGGAWLEINDMQFDLAHGKPTIVVAKDGTPRIQDR